MQLSSFQRTLLYGAGALAAVGGGIGLVVARNHRIEETDTAAREAGIDVDRFTDAVIDAYDHSSYVDPLQPPAQSGEEIDRTPDGVLAIGADDYSFRSRGLYPEIVGELGYQEVASGREFLRRADSDGNDLVTRDELRAAIAPFAGDDGLLGEAERRRLLLDEGLARPSRRTQEDTITGWLRNGDNSVQPAGYVASAFMRDIERTGVTVANAGERGARSVRVDDVEARFPWARREDDEPPMLESGEITTLQPALARIDDAGDGDGVVTEREVAEFVATEYRTPGLLDGHVRLPGDAAALIGVLDRQQVGRIDRSTLQGHAYLDPGVPKGDIDRFYGGNLARWLNAQPGVRDALGGVAWKPDPDS